MAAQQMAAPALLPPTKSCPELFLIHSLFSCYDAVAPCGGVVPSYRTLIRTTVPHNPARITFRANTARLSRHISRFETMIRSCTHIPWCAQFSAAVQPFLTRLGCLIKDGSLYANSYCRR